MGSEVRQLVVGSRGIFRVGRGGFRRFVRFHGGAFDGRLLKAAQAFIKRHDLEGF